MAVNFNRLWKLLIDKKMKKTDLITMADLSSATLAKMGKDQQVSMEVLSKICKVLECNIGDIIAFIYEEKTKNE